MKLPAGYYIDRTTGDRWELRGPNGSTVATLSGSDDLDTEILARVHWNGYNAGVLHTLREVGRRQEVGRTETLLHLDAIEHDLLHQVHIV